MPEITLAYFDFPGGRGEDCRLALHIAGVPFHDDRVRGPDWAGRKASTPWGGLPVLTVEGRGELGQSNAILAYIGREHGLHPADPFEAARHEAVMAACEDLRHAFGPSLSEKDPELKRALREELASGFLQRWAACIERQLGPGPFLAGDDPCVADLKLYVLLRWILSGSLDHVPPSSLDGHPALLAHYHAVDQHPGVRSWYAR